MKKRRLLAAFLAVVLCVLMLPAQSFAADVVASGTCGENLTWSLDSEGTLTVSGSGDMTNFPVLSAWNEYGNSIVNVIIEDGVTSIGNYAFSRCEKIVSVTIPATVRKIGVSAFQYCNGLTAVSIPAGVTEILSKAFYECDQLTEVMLPDTVVSIGEQAFTGCSELRSCPIPESVRTIGKQAFSFCYALKNAEIPHGVTRIEDETFYYCLRLVSVRIPGTVTSIGSKVFDNCNALSKVYYEGTEEQWNGVNNQSNLGKAEIIYDPREPEPGDDTPSNPGDSESGQGDLEDEIIAEGVFGYDSLTWRLNSRGILTISGAGGIYYWERISCPWNDYRNEIVSVVIKKGITRIHEEAFANHTNMVSITIADTVTSIGNHAFYMCDSLIDIYIPGSVTNIEFGAFKFCDNLTYVRLSDGLERISSGVFEGCDRLTDIIIPESVTHIESGAFQDCDSLTRITIPEGVTAIEDRTFYSCNKLKTITIPASVTKVGDMAFAYAQALQDVFYGGSAEQWKRIDINPNQDIYDPKPYNQPLLDATVHFDVPSSIRYAQMQVSTDVTNLAIEVGDVITFSVAVLSKDGERIDPTGVTFQLSDGYTVKVLDTGIDPATNQLFVQLQGAIEGTGYVTFSDSTTGNVASLPLTVREENYETFTLNTVPLGTVFNGIRDEGPLNFYNWNGLYVDSFKATVADSGKALVSFDVYNTNHTYAIVEVYDENGELYNAVLIDKMDYLNDGIKSVLWDGTGCVVRDVFLGNALTYKQETNFSKRTAVEIEVPKDGYIQITADSMESAILAVVNSADMLMSTLSLLDKAEGYVNGDFEIPKRLTEQLCNDDNFKDAIKGGKDFCKKVLKGLGKDATITSKTVGGFADTVIKNLKELNLLKLVLDSAMSAGVGIAEDTIQEMMGIFGDALELVFTIGAAGDLACQYNSYLGTVNGGVITIQNQGGGKRHCDNIVLESEVDFDPEVALQVYSVTLDEALLEKVKNKDAHTYKMLTKYVTRTYNISLLKNGEETQHSSDVAVYIPIPYDLEYLDLEGHIKVFRVEEDGTVTDMDAVVDGDCIMFTTDHFSIYTLVFEGIKETPNDQEDDDADKKPGNKHDDDDQEPAGNGGVIVVIVVVVVLLAGGGVAVLIVLKKKKQ